MPSPPYHAVVAPGKPGTPMIVYPLALRPPPGAPGLLSPTFNFDPITRALSIYENGVWSDLVAGGAPFGVLGFMFASTDGSTDDRWMFPWAGRWNSSDMLTSRFVVRPTRACTLARLRVGSADGSVPGQDVVFTVEVGGASTALVATIPAGQDHGENVIDAAVVPDGATVSLRYNYAAPDPPAPLENVVALMELRP